LLVFCPGDIHDENGVSKPEQYHEENAGEEYDINYCF